MLQQDNIFPIAEHVNYFGQALVIEEENSLGEVRVRWLQDKQTKLANAKIAFLRDDILQSETNVLLAGNSVDNMFVIGVLGSAPTSKKKENAIVHTSQGAFAQLHRDEATESIAVYSEQKELLFTYDPVKQVSTVNIQQGDLELNSPQGSIKLNAGKSVELNTDMLALNSKRLSIKSLVGEIVVGRLETATETLIESAKNVYRSVKELSQLRSGRVRTLVDETYQLNADKVLVKSENDFKVKAEKIHLG